MWLLEENNQNTLSGIIDSDKFISEYLNLSTVMQEEASTNRLQQRF